MKKLWIYMAVPMTLLNGCQIRPAQAAPTVNTVAERETGQEQTIPVEQKVPQNQQGMAAQTIKEAAFHGSTVTIAKSQKIRAADITEEEIEAMVRMAASDLKTVVKNGQTVVLKPNLVQMIVDSTAAGSGGQRDNGGLACHKGRIKNGKGVKSGWKGLYHGGIGDGADQRGNEIFPLHSGLYGGSGWVSLSGGGLRGVAGF